ncbi:MAG: VCBS repeat-containing protein [Chitinophagales bacterium]
MVFKKQNTGFLFSQSPLIILVLLCVFFAACNTTEPEGEKNKTEATSKIEQEPPLFKELGTDQTGIAFRNQIVTGQYLNHFVFWYFYNGGGVAIGDLNNDDLPDIYFTANLVSDKLYLNKGDLKFEDISKKAGTHLSAGWRTGVNMVDINADGWMDIYICRSGWKREDKILKNLLYINKGVDKSTGIPQFEEEAEKYGLADAGHSIQSVFFDYDLDGDLDMYLTNHPFVQAMKQTLEEKEANSKNPSDRERDKLYRNNGKGKFKEVGLQSGIKNYAYGLGLGVSDINEDGYPDIYIGNDFQFPDFYYVNNKDGTFTESFEKYFKHSSYFSMGTDIADINNDGHLDIFVAEMLAKDNKRQKTNMAPMNVDFFWSLVDKGFYYQYMRNSMHLNQGNGHFSDIVYLSGLSNSDWSWGTLFVDFDQDGFKDLAVTNGYLYDTQDKDYGMYVNKLSKTKKGGFVWDDLKDVFQSTPIPNCIFKNNGDLTFSDKSKTWGFDFNGFSNGLAHADLDLDGDVDLVVNNINSAALVYQNQEKKKKKGNYLRIQLEGKKPNIHGLGTKVSIETSAGQQCQELQVVRGFQSSSEYVLHFGLGEATTVNKIQVVWQDGKEQVLEGVEANQVLKVKQADAQRVNAIAGKEKSEPIFEEVTASFNPIFEHQENNYDDYAKELLLPHKQSQNGPKLAVGDVNGDGLEDFYIGGAARQSGALYLQQTDGRFTFSNKNVIEADKECEDIGALFFDADTDGDLDLYVVSGGNEFSTASEYLRDRLYINDGEGNFKKGNERLPDLKASGACVVANDFDQDGDQDLFVGSRLIPQKYPFAPASYLLQNEGGKFTDVTQKVAPELLEAGLVTDAVWTDVDGDKWVDLVVVGEWMPIRIFKNEGGKALEEVGQTMGLSETNGWWNSIAAKDMDGDGDEDLVVGNLGLNYKYQASKDEPFQVFCSDFDDSGSLDIVLGYFNEGVCFPVRGRQCSSEQMPMIKDKYASYKEFGEASLFEVYGEKSLKEALNLKAYQFASVYLENQGADGFEVNVLPVEAQIAPIQGIVCSDFDKDGKEDILIAGNWYVSEVETSRADAGTGLLLKGDGKGAWKAVNVLQSGFWANEDVRDLAVVKSGTSQWLMVANNDTGMQIFRINERIKDER